MKSHRLLWLLALVGPVIFGVSMLVSYLFGHAAQAWFTVALVPSSYFGGRRFARWEIRRESRP